jgi:uncharacterized protein
MVSRTTDDYKAIVLAGCRAVCEPAFWAGYDRGSVAGFRDYFSQLTDYEPRRAARYGIPHFCWLCINPKEAENHDFALEVINTIPEFLVRPNVLGIGEIGLNKNSRNELRTLEAQVELAAKYDQLVLVHTPHLEDKLKGTRLIVDVLKAHPLIRPDRVIIDHVEEHTVELALDAGFWAGITLYPESKCTAPRAVDMLDLYGLDRIWLNSACDWGHSDPVAVPRAALEMLRRGYSRVEVDKIVFDNPKLFLSQNTKFSISDATLG